MTEIAWVGGSEDDRRQITAQHAAYLEANSEFDWERLQGIWSSAPDGTFFNMNGHTYNGREHWTRLWQYYKANMRTGEWVPFDMGGTISGDLAAVWCHRHTRISWAGADPMPEGRPTLNQGGFVSRSTMVFRREDGEWRVVHTHFSEGSKQPRPGGV